MEQKHILKVMTLCSVTLLMLSACSPRVMTEVTMTYPARTADEVKVYDIGDTVPNNSVALGKVAVLDRGFTTNCGYDRMLSLAKEKTAETGGNGLLLTYHKEPSIWGSSCHQLMGTMFLMNDMTVDPTRPNPVMDAAKRDAEETARTIEERMPPRNTFKLSFGPSCIVSEVQTGVGTYKSLWGWDVAAEYQHSWRSGIGVGANALFNITSYHYLSNIRRSLIILYIGPSVTWGTKLHKNWLMNIEFGLGYAHVDDSFLTSNGLGVQWQFGIDYMINKNWGLGIEANSLSTFMKKPDNITLPDDKHYGFGRFNVLVGLRYYF